MKMTSSKIFSKVAIALTAFSSGLILSTPVDANEVQQIPSSYINIRETTFFTQGREKFEAEIRFLTKINQKLTDNILKYDPQIPKQQEKLFLQKKSQSFQDDSNVNKSISLMY
ncbi:hypothetical protein CLI64_11950 [Nostoc sp. CENA543]|uniref:hypothetical protein n=1 Tax=Nostoc sp. CENA543 TaxID=1869241 RepID=UPI000CA0FD2D|nr:hypothetical protein [Nostoc sp. CENA543]AUT01056.1 hypothetical protein CLI64_11950 [Nostoc sp. CENA543]